jgi:thiol-disulfide isomerase/thioredoxin
MKFWVIAVLTLMALSSSAGADALQNLVRHKTPVTLPQLHFLDGAGQDRTLDNFRGKVVLLNLWATWCGPCRTEMPILDRLQAELGGPDFEVLPLSIDRRGAEAVRKFYADLGIKHLNIYIDPSSKAGFGLGFLGLPTTILIDREGREVGRLVGPAEWDAPEVIALIKSLIADKQALHSFPQ